MMFDLSELTPLIRSYVKKLAPYASVSDGERNPVADEYRWLVRCGNSYAYVGVTMRLVLECSQDAALVFTKMRSSVMAAVKSVLALEKDNPCPHCGRRP